MSLDWNVSHVLRHEQMCYRDDGSLNPITEALIWKTLSVGIGEITEANAAEFIARLAIIEAIDGFVIFEEGKGRPISEEEVVAHIGLRTNVFPALTRAQWLKQQIGSRADDRKRYAQRAINRKKEPTNG